MIDKPSWNWKLMQADERYLKLLENTENVVQKYNGYDVSVYNVYLDFLVLTR